MKIKRLYLNLPIFDVQKTRAFWSALGFEFNEQFSDDQALCMILKEDAVFAMLISRPYFATFTNRPIFDGGTTQILCAIEVESKERVDDIVKMALANGGRRYLDPVNESWMYYDRFVDIDGHQWEVTFMDESLLNMPTP